MAAPPLEESSSDFRFKVVLLGKVDVGKSSLFLRLIDKEFYEDTTKQITPGIEYRVRTVTINNVSVDIAIYDTAGQERFRVLTSSYYRNADAILMVYDITDRDSFKEVENLHLEGNRYASRALNFLIGNKLDLEKSRGVTSDEAMEVAKSLGVTKIIETSAKSGENTEKLFEMISHGLLDRVLNDNRNNWDENIVVLTPSNGKDKRSNKGIWNHC